MLKRQSLFFLLLLFGFLTAGYWLSAEETAYPESYYGVCAHIGFNDPLTSQKLVKMREAGIRWARADFVWGLMEKPQGEWHFESIDSMLDEAEKNGISILPILDYSVPWAFPVTEHLDEWCNYVRTVVTRYKDRIRYWEVWNEENLKQFWVNEANGAEYAKLLKASYETIKAIDPELTVVYGGLSGVPMKYIEETLQAGAGDYFDVMNFHPYRGGFFSIQADDQLISDTTAIHNMMEQYGAHNKPIWITEMGWASLPGAGEGFSIFLNAAFALLREEKAQLKVAVLDDLNYPESQISGLMATLQSLPNEVQILPITVDQLGTVSPEQYDALMLPPGESFPSPYFDDLCRYVQNGGTLFLTGGVPFYYEVKQNEQGEWVRNKDAAPEIFRQRMRIAWRAHWFDDTVPANAAEVHPTDLLRQSGQLEQIDRAFFKAASGRFLSDARLCDGDEMIPLAVCPHNDAELPCAVLYRFNSDWKGKIIVSTIWQWADGNTSNVADQAVFLAQAMLLARCGGVSKYFWYELQAPEVNPQDKESYFGITHADLSPKPGYIAYQTLTTAAPEGSAEFCRAEPDRGIEIVSWQRPDGKKAWAVWSPGHIRTLSLKVDGTIDQAYNLLGEPVETTIKDGVLTGTWTPAIQYFIGPEQITFLP